MELSFSREALVVVPTLKDPNRAVGLFQLNSLAVRGQTDSGRAVRVMCINFLGMWDKPHKPEDDPDFREEITQKLQQQIDQNVLVVWEQDELEELSEANL